MHSIAVPPWGHPRPKFFEGAVVALAKPHRLRRESRDAKSVCHLIASARTEFTMKMERITA